ncbi:MAG TPA: SusC/RagA family TonB-linked outer membrane protein [Puia sp.]|nr:SusC/RagA family TonB-linked outer membrane protein [Puia sp.]
MKSSLLPLLLTACFLLAGRVSNGQDLSKIEISIHLKNTTLKKAFHEMEGLSAISFTYKTDDIAGYKNINLQEEHISLSDLLNILLKNTDLQYEQVNANIIIKKKKEATATSISPWDLGGAANKDSIRGKVVDEKGEELVGVTVSVKGHSKATQTNVYGDFLLVVPNKRAVLTFSYVGHAGRTIDLEKEDANLVVLKAGVSNMREVVVTALGLSKDSKKLGYSVTTIGGDQLNRARETNVALSLAGQVAGLNVHGTSGGPGGSARILLRGMPSMNSGGSPLFVINGVPMDNTQRGAAGEWGGSDYGDGIGNINPDDIETVTVLKGQAASALYGTRATNGVIMITTKTGKKGDFTVEYNTNAAWDKAINSTNYQYVYGQGQNGNKPANQTEARNTARLAWGAKMDGSLSPQFDGNSYPYSPYKNNIADFYRTGPSLTNTIAVSNGGDRGTFRLSLSNLDNSSIVRNSGLNRKTINLNVMQKITDKLSATVIANYIDEQDKNRSQLSDGPGNPNNGMFLAPNIKEKILAPGYDAQGNEVVFSDDNYVTNPWFAVNKFINNTGRKRMIAAVSAKYNFTDWLYAQGRVGYDQENDRLFQVTPTGTNFSFNAAGQSGQLNELTNLQTFELNLDGLIGVSHHLTEDLKLDATLGINSRKNGYEYIEIYGSQFVIPYLYTPSNVVTYGRYYYYYQKLVNSGYYTLDFNYKDFLFLTTTGRYDAYSTLLDHNRTIFTPSVSAGFIFTQFLHTPLLNYGKLRAAYAQTSGEPIGGPNNTQSGAYQTSLYYGVGNAINGVPVGLLNGSSGSVNNLPSLPNLFLKPFVLAEIEFGTELKFFNSRLGLDVAYFSRKTKHEIQSAPLSEATGYSNTYVGTGSTWNRGLEVELTGTPVNTNKFSWNITFNLTNVKNKILETDEAGNNVTLGTYRPLNANTAFVKGMPGPQILAHDYTYDVKGDIIVDASGLPIQGGLVPMGNVLPTTYGGLKNDFSYRNFNLSFLIDYNYGNKILSATSYYTIYRGLNKMTLAGRETGITIGVLSGSIPNTVAADAEDYYQRLSGISKLNVLNGDYIKLRQITFGYTLSEKALARLPVFRAIEISLVARNLLTLMKHSDNIDPEAAFSSNVKYAGIEGTSLPSSRTFGVNANFKFRNGKANKPPSYLQ